MESSIIFNIFISVFSGVLTSALIFLFIKVLYKIIIPWYQSIVYRGFDISGEWLEEHNYKNIFTQESKIIIKQTAHLITGTITLAKRKDNDEVIAVKHFSFKGEFYNNHLNITCWNVDKRQIGMHNYLLRFTLEGKGMEGFKTYFDVGFEKIKSEEVTWHRI